MKDIKIPVIKFLAFCALGAFLFWVGGFDFNRRGDDVALGIFFTVVLSALFTILSEMGKTK